MNNLLFDQIKDKFQTGDFASAEKLCFKLYQTQDKNINVVKNLALACMLQKKYFEAVHFYHAALNLDKLDFDVNSNLAYCSHKQRTIKSTPIRPRSEKNRSGKSDTAKNYGGNLSQSS